MSKARLVITAVTVEKRPVSEVAKSYGVARSWVYALLDRYQAEGDAAFEPRSRRPKTSPSATSPDTAELINRMRKELAGQGLDAGPQTITWHLEQHHQVKVSPATVSRALARNGLVTPDPSKRPKSSCIRFEASMPNECRQSDFTHYPPAALADLQAQLDAFASIHNTRRPHRSLQGRATPATAFAARPKAVPATAPPDTHDRVRTDRTDATGLVTLRHNGKLHHTGTGRSHAGTRVLLLVQNLHIRVINADTSELLRELVLNPQRDYQPTGKRPGWPKKTPRTIRRFAVSSMSCDITRVARVGFEPT